MFVEKKEKPNLLVHLLQEKSLKEQGQYLSERDK